MYEGLLNKKFKDLSDEEKKMRREIESDPNSDRFKQYEKDLKAAREGPSSSFGTDAKPLLDFAVIGGEIVELPKTAIVSSGKVQAFSGKDTVIGFKEGEALITGINNLLDVGKSQLKALNNFLEKSGNNVIDASTANTVSNTYNVESGVSAFRKALT